MGSKVECIMPIKKRIFHKVGIYCRVSTSGREQLDSLSEQISEMTRLVAMVDQWKLADAFVDIESAKGDTHRKQFERMIKMCEKKELSIIVTKSMSRFGRDTVETLTAIRKLKSAGVRVIFVQENLDTNEDNEYILTILEASAQHENESRSANIRWGLVKGAENGTSGVYRRVAYGYKHDAKKNLIIDEEKAEVVRKIFQWYLEGMSTVRLVRKLQEEKIPSPQGNEKWCKASVDSILNNTKYMGTVIIADSGREGCGFQLKDANPPIISEEEFNAVQQLREKRTNVEYDENGTAHRKSTKYSCKRKE